MKNSQYTKIPAGWHSKRWHRIQTMIVLLFMLVSTVTLTQSTYAQTPSIPSTNVAGVTSQLPPGWTATEGSCDVSDDLIWGGQSIYPWQGAPIGKPTGSNFISCGSNKVTPPGDAVETYEAASTTVTGLTPGLTTKLTFYLGGHRSVFYSNGAAISPCPVDVRITIGVAQQMYRPPCDTWTLYEFTWTPVGASETFTFRTMAEGANTTAVANLPLLGPPRWKLL